MSALFSAPPNRKRLEPAERRRRRSQKALAALWAASHLAVTGAAAAAVAWSGRSAWRYATTAPRFAIAALEVRGAQQLSTAQVQALSGIAVGQNIFLAELGEAQRRLEEQPWIRSVAVRRRLPRTVEIDLRERRPLAYVDFAGLYLVDDRGQIFKRAAADDAATGAADALDLPSITGLARADFIAGKADLREALGWALALIAPPSGTAVPWDPGELSEVHFDPDLGVTLQLGPLPTAVELGFPPFEEKLERLRRARRELTRRQLRASALYLDDSRQPDHVGMALAGLAPAANPPPPSGGGTKERQ